MMFFSPGLLFFRVSSTSDQSFLSFLPVQFFGEPVPPPCPEPDFLVFFPRNLGGSDCVLLSLSSLTGELSDFIYLAPKSPYWVSFPFLLYLSWFRSLPPNFPQSHYKPFLFGLYSPPH